MSEVRTIKKCTPQLETALKGLDAELVHFLHREGFITNIVHDKIFNPSSSWDEADKASELVKWIRNRVQQDSESYHTFVNWLKDCEKHYQPIVNILEVEYNRGDLPPADLKQLLQSNLAAILTCFSDYTFCIQASLMAMNVDIKVISSYLWGLPSFSDSCHRSLALLSAKKERFERAVDIIDIFIILEKCTSFTSYHIYEHLISKFEIANEELRTLNYPLRLQEYIEKHKISEYILVHPSLKQCSDDTKDLILVLDIDTTCRLSKLLDIGEAVAKVMNLDPLTLLMHNVVQRCVVTFHIPSIVAEIIFTEHQAEVFSREQREMFRNLSVRKLQCSTYEFDFTRNIAEVSGSHSLKATTEMPSVEISSLSPDMHGDLIQQLQHCLEELIVSYASYSHGVLRSLKENHISPAEVSASLLSLPAFVDNQSHTLLSEKAPEMSDADSIAKIFIVLNCEWCSFLNFEVLQHMIREFKLGLPERNIKYPEKCRQYVEMHKISELVLVQPVLREITHDFREVFLCLDIESTCRVSRLLNIGKAVANILGLQHSSLLYQSVRKDCSGATFLLPTSVAQFIFTGEGIFTQEQVLEFRASLVQKLECNGCKFDFTH